MEFKDVDIEIVRFRECDVIITSPKPEKTEDHEIILPHVPI